MDEKNSHRDSKFYGLDVNSEFLLPFLSPTSKGTNWWDSPPQHIVHDRYVGRALLQFHQVSEHLLNSFKDPADVNFLDVGTGNGLLPEMIGLFISVGRSVGLDPYEDGEHTTSWAKGTRNELRRRLIQHLKQTKVLDYENYRSICKNETMRKRPSPIPLTENNIIWEFKKQFIHQVSPKEKFDFLFAKAIDHIHDWPRFFSDLTKVANDGATLLIKHNSFYSFHGAHRYASTFIPWGHARLTERQYADYVSRFHEERAPKMLDFYANGLSYPRYSVREMIELLGSNGWTLNHLEFDETPQLSKKLDLIDGGWKSLLDEIRLQKRDIGLEEILSNRILLKFSKIG